MLDREFADQALPGRGGSTGQVYGYAVRRLKTAGRRSYVPPAAGTLLDLGTASLPTTRQSSRRNENSTTDRVPSN
ncbi:uncharacterized protein CLUP02_15246 [Colletotrichum lupini]|uniref:Uncharacterized protein n=1 Tax=Colletotrichum lupini TaxID=145971 RepID=A0A9Q8T654_9PEZI|nr:uncharacterized protein CLUP02_15246 [Colletotrichum lupini]UQC89715.1 hypothetical protein CLUP02_15246 [Colletotrichum lupini]